MKRAKCSRPLCTNDADYRLEGWVFENGEPLLTCIECLPALVDALVLELAVDREAL